MRFLLVCGGTAGHINPALAVAGKLRDLIPGSEFLFVGSGREMEKKLIPAEGYPLKNITVSGFSRGLSVNALKKNFKMVRNLMIAAGQSEKIIRNFKPDAVIGTGGYVCYPVLKKASQLGIPTVLHESNAIPGLTTKMLAKKVDKIMVAFPGAGESYHQSEKVVVTGTPIRGDFDVMTKEEAKKRLGYSGKPLVVSFWGSLGASVMNEYMADFIARNVENHAFAHIHATGGGEAGMEKMMQRLQKRGIEKLDDGIEIRPYIHDMGTVMTAADLVMCRAGASTIAELTMMGKPSILVPSPNVTNNHQEKNAREVERAGGAKVFLENECSGEQLFQTVSELVTDQNALQQMSEKTEKLGIKDSSLKIAELVLSLIN